MKDAQELYHFGIPGMRWGKRKNAQNMDTSAGSGTSAKPRLSTGKKVAIGVAATGAGVLAVKATSKLSFRKKLAVGATLTTAVLGAIGGYTVGSVVEKRRTSKREKRILSTLENMTYSNPEMPTMN